MTTERNETTGLSARLTYLLKRALVDLEDLHAKQLAPIGISGRELGVLLLLNDQEPESQQHTAARLGVDRTTMVGLLDGLEAKGLVARRADLVDRRRNVVELTEDGHTALARAVRASDEAERQLLAQLDGAESVQLRTLLMRLATYRPRETSARLDFPTVSADGAVGAEDADGGP